MIMRYTIYTLLFLVLFCSFSFGITHYEKTTSKITASNIAGAVMPGSKKVEVRKKSVPAGDIDRNEFIAFAKTLLGTPYLYASSNPAKGFDCSGFINYVSNHFGLKVPRSSVDFTNAGNEINIQSAMPGDFILFTGTDSSNRTVGHIGIITSTENGIEFIHSSSGKANGVTMSYVEGYYESRFVKVVRMI
jgi:cell wall-associated NlpC family hydrolase